MRLSETHLTRMPNRQPSLSPAVVPQRPVARNHSSDGHSCLSLLLTPSPQTPLPRSPVLPSYSPSRRTTNQQSGGCKPGGPRQAARKTKQPSIPSQRARISHQQARGREKWGLYQASLTQLLCSQRSQSTRSVPFLCSYSFGAADLCCGLKLAGGARSTCSVRRPRKRRY
jgi:hypothetical protein